MNIHLISNLIVTHKNFVDGKALLREVKGKWPAVRKDKVTQIITVYNHIEQKSISALNLEVDVLQQQKTPVKESESVPFSSVLKYCSVLFTVVPII